MAPHRFAGLRMLALGQPLELLLADLSVQSPHVRKPPLPLAANDAVLVVKGLLGAGEFLRMIRLSFGLDFNSGRCLAASNGRMTFSRRTNSAVMARRPSGTGSYRREAPILQTMPLPRSL
jgi:hypothetical protein